MIVTILPGSSNFHAVGYNEHKVSKGQARLLEMQNFGNIGLFGDRTVNELVSYLRSFSSRNSRIKNPQFHFAVSCKGHSMSETELLDFTHRYLQEMGYSDQGQPVLIYSHTDTANTHLHVVTTRVAPDGRKISHGFERVRSQQAIDKILGIDTAKKTDKDIQKAMQYSFSSVSQFKAILSTMGYETYQEDDTLYIKKGGTIKQKIPEAELQGLFSKRARDIKRQRQLSAILKKYHETNTDKEGLCKDLKKNFGIDLVFFGRKDEPYGYMLVDHKNKTVTNGSYILKVKALLSFGTTEEKLSDINAFIWKMLENNSSKTTWEINDKLFRHHACLKKGVLYYKDSMHQLDPEIAARILRNDKLARIRHFQPNTEREREILCGIYKIDDKDLVSLSSERNSSYDTALNRIREIFSLHEGKELRNTMKEAGYGILRNGDDYFAINFHSKVFIHLNKEGLDVSRIYAFKSYARDIVKDTKNVKTTNKHSRIQPVRNPGKGQGSHYANREWEVGKKSRNQDDPEESNNLKY